MVEGMPSFLRRQEPGSLKCGCPEDALTPALTPAPRPHPGPLPQGEGVFFYPLPPGEGLGVRGWLRVCRRSCVGRNLAA